MTNILLVKFLRWSLIIFITFNICIIDLIFVVILTTSPIPKEDRGTYQPKRCEWWKLFCFFFKSEEFFNLENLSNLKLINFWKWLGAVPVNYKIQWQYGFWLSVISVIFEQDLSPLCIDFTYQRTGRTSLFTWSCSVWLFSFPETLQGGLILKVWRPSRESQQWSWEASQKNPSSNV